MYGEKSYGLDSNVSAMVQQPDLQVIIERLQNALNLYDCIVHDTRFKLQSIKKVNKPLTPPSESEIEPPSESAIEEINRLIYRLNDLNEKAEGNLQHLREIV